MRNISCFLTEDAVRAGTKTVTRRIGWHFLKVGTMLRVVRKGMGLKPGERIVPLAVVEVVSVQREPLETMVLREPPFGHNEVCQEGFDPQKMTPEAFVEFFCQHMKCTPKTVVTRIQWRYRSRCLQCGFEISKDSDYCGECTCEQDCL